MSAANPVLNGPRSTQEQTQTIQESLTYRGARLRAATFPVGGIGTGTVALAGDGALRQWQIVNNVNHDAHVPNSFFAIWTGGRRNRRGNAIVLQSAEQYDDEDFQPAPSVSDHMVPEASRQLLAKLPGVEQLSMTAQYPIVEVDYERHPLPVSIKLETFSPFIPLNSADSGIPVILFNFQVTNPHDEVISVSLMAAQQNLVGWDGKSAIQDNHNIGYGGNVNSVTQLRDVTLLDMRNTHLASDHPSNGSLVLAALHGGGDALDEATGEAVTYTSQWTNLDELWNHFITHRGRLPEHGPLHASPQGVTWNGALSTHFTLQPGASRTVTFMLAWHFPNRYVTWLQGGESYQMGITDRKSKFWLGNQYANRFGSGLAVVEYVRDHFARLCTQTRQYRDRFFSGSLPWVLLESVAGPVSTIRTPTCIWTEDGLLHGFEGCHGASTSHGVLDGCCPMDCTHVWNYEMALAKLFPDLEQGMRRIDLIHQISPWGSIPHRTVLPMYLPRAWDDFIGGPRNPAMDGELGTVLKTYREIRHGADREWFDLMWPAVKKLMQHVMEDYDTEGDGVIRGEQPNTYDISIYGPNTFIGTLYLAALRAAEEMAKLQGENELAQKYRERFELGRANYVRICWNGEYFVQIVDLETHAEMQFATGCHIDQLLGQWWANSLNLGYLLPAEHVQTTLRNIYRNNRKIGFRKEEQRPRIYMDERDSGLYICTWPHGDKPDSPTLYSDEIWSGLEYPLAAMLLHEQETSKALTMLRDIRDRHDGSRRSPWNEVECGDHYVRPMASWNLLEEASGFDYSAIEQRLRVMPRLWQEETFASFLITGSGWGGVSFGPYRAELSVDYGSISLQTLELGRPSTGASTQTKIDIGGQPIQASVESIEGGLRLVLDEPILLVAGETLTVNFA